MAKNIAAAATALLFCWLVSSGAETAWSASPLDTLRLDSAKQAEIIDSVCSRLNRQYVFPEVAAKMTRHVRDRFSQGAYKRVTMLAEFADTVVANLFDVCGDRHLYLRVGDTVPSYYLPIDSLPPGEKARYMEDEARANYGFVKVERMDGNIGYIELTEFADPRLGGSTAVAAMEFLSNCDAMIIDLRRNGGGDGTMGLFLSTYFFASQVCLSTIHWRTGDTLEQGWTGTYVPGKRRPDIPLYILTSTATFSAAEAFTNDLQARKRAVVVGEHTRGGGHPITVELLSGLHLYISIPTGNTINAVTHKSFEGVGITPDIVVPWEKALHTAYVEALAQVRARATDEDRKRQMTWYIEAQNALAHPFPTKVKLLQKYVGVYGERTVTLENGTLCIQRQGRPRYRLVAMSADTFVLENASMRVRFSTDAAGRTAEMTCEWDDGTTATAARSTH